jgi:hypothetical protein
MLPLAEAIIRIRFKIDGTLRLRCKVGNSRSFLARKICRGLHLLARGQLRMYDYNGGVALKAQCPSLRSDDAAS